MLDSETLKTGARLLAIEIILSRLFAKVHERLSPSQFDAEIAAYWEGLSAQTIPGLDAPTSDAIAAEIRDEVQRILNDARESRSSA